MMALFDWGIGWESPSKSGAEFDEEPQPFRMRTQTSAVNAVIARLDIKGESLRSKFSADGWPCICFVGFRAEAHS